MIDKNPYRTLHARMSPPGAAWDEGFAAGRAAASPDPPPDTRWRWTIHICPKGHKSLEPPLNGVCWACWPGGRGPAEEHTAVPVAEVLPADSQACRAPHCWAEYGTPCADCPKETL